LQQSHRHRGRFPVEATVQLLFCFILSGGKSAKFGRVLEPGAFAASVAVRETVLDAGKSIGLQFERAEQSMHVSRGFSSAVSMAFLAMAATDFWKIGDGLRKLDRLGAIYAPIPREKHVGKSVAWVQLGPWEIKCATAPRSAWTRGEDFGDFLGWWPTWRLDLPAATTRAAPLKTPPANTCR